MTTLFDVLNNGYKDKKKKSKNLNGYVMDEELSNKHYQTYYDPKDKKLLFNVTGTRPTASDWLNNINLGLGIGFKESKRYQESHKGLRDAKQKYNVQNATVTGHSKGGLISNYISSKGDKVITLDAAQSILNKSQSGSKNYRSNGDIVSLLGANKHNTINLSNPNKQLEILFMIFLMHMILKISKMKNYLFENNI